MVCPCGCPKMRSCALTRHDALASWGPMCRVLYRLLVSLVRLAVRSGRSKDLEIIVLRHQLAVLRRQNHRPALADEDRALLGAIAAAVPRPQRTGWLVTPETLLRWHRRRIARHWTQPCRAPGRPCTSVELRRLIIEMATNNPTWGYRRITGELVGLGHRVGASNVWRILKQHRIEPAPQRTSVTWAQFLGSQTARNLFLRHPQRLTHARALLGDRASQFPGDFDEIFRTEGLKILRTPVRVPASNAFAERWIGTLRREPLDRTIIWSQHQLEHLVIDCIDRYNAHRPHRSPDQRPPASTKPPNANGQQQLRIIRATRCGGLINEYRRAA